MQNADWALGQLTPSMALLCAVPTFGVVTMAQLGVLAFALVLASAAPAGTAVTVSQVPSSVSAAATQRAPVPM